MKKIRDNKGMYFLLYSFFWLAGSLFIYRYYRADGRSMLWLNDGVYQHYPAFSYVCDIAESVLHGHFDLSGMLPFNYTICQGVDLFTTLNSYDFADPVSWLCASLLFLSRVHRYAAMVFAKLWLAGAAFSVYCFVTARRNNAAVLCGALAYTFSGSILFMFARHPNYINWAYFLPLMLGGYELYRSRRKKGLLMGAVFFNLLVSFYTLYINAILLVLYVVVRSIAAWSKNRKASTLTEELVLDLRSAGVCVLGALLGAFSLLPTIYTYLQNPRVGGLSGYSTSLFQYDAQFYRDLFASWFVPFRWADYTTVVCLFGVCLIGILCFYISREDDASGRNRAMKIYGLLLLVMMCVPIVGRVMNGMGYASNRWNFAVAFAAAAMLTESFDGLTECPLWKRAVIVGIALLYVLAAWSMKDAFDGDTKNAAMIMILVTLGIYFVSSFAGRRIAALSLAAVTVACVFFQCYYFYSPEEGAYPGDFLKEKRCDAAYTDSSTLVSGLSAEDNFFRAESLEYRVNADGINHVNGTSAWWSLLPGNNLNYLNAFELNTIVQNCFFSGLDTRAALMELAGIRYYTAPSDKRLPAPYGFEYVPGMSAGKYKLYENRYALPIGYTFRNYISREQFDAMGPIERQEALLQGAVLEMDDCEDIGGAVPEITAQSDAYELEFEIGTPKDAVITGDTMEADCSGASVPLYAQIPDNAEIYLEISGVEILNPDGGNIDVVRRNNKAGFRLAKDGKITNLSNNWPVMREGITYNLGAGAPGKNQIVLVFSKQSRFTYDSIKLWAVPMDTYVSRAKALKENEFTDVRVNGRGISGTIEVPQDRIMQFAVPYSAGWSAFVDGQKVKTMRSDELYTAILLPAGHHDVTLRYRTPYMREGAVLSLITLAALAGVYEKFMVPGTIKKV